MSGEVEKWLENADWIECRRYNARITKLACASYRKANKEAYENLRTPEDQALWVLKEAMENYESL